MSAMQQELYLEAASMGHLPGCAPNPSIRWWFPVGKIRRKRKAPEKQVPAKPLVGIETNPGPPKLLKSLGRDLLRQAASDAGFALGAAVGTKKKAIAKTKKKKVHPNLKQTLSAKAVLAPMNPGMVYQQRIASNSNIVPFEIVSARLLTDSSGVLMFQDFQTSTNSQYWALDPNNNRNIFGYAVRTIAGAYQRFRVRKLRVFYDPVCTSTTVGAVAIAYTPQNTTVVTGFDLAYLMNLDGVGVNSVWQPSEIAARHLDKTWKYVWDPQSEAQADLNQYHAGQLACCAAASLAASTTFGFLRLVGEIEFSDLAPPLPVMPALTAPRAASSSPLLSADQASSSSTFKPELGHVGPASAPSSTPQPPQGWFRA